MGHKCFISFKTEDIEYKKTIQNDLNIDMIDKSLDIPIDSYDEDYIMRKIREDYLSDSTVTIHLIGMYSAEKTFMRNQTYIKRELQASLYNGKKNKRNGILGVVLPTVQDKIYLGTYACNQCKNEHNNIDVENWTVKEFSYNYFIPKDGCSWSEEDRYCVLVKWDDFIINPDYYIEKAYQKRFSSIASKIRVKP